MSDDLVKELDAFRRDLLDFKEKWQDDDIWSVLNRVADKIEIYADRIEQLEAALRELSCKCTSNCDWERDDICPSWIARKALEGKDGT
jgi:hypothetical protein